MGESELSFTKHSQIKLIVCLSKKVFITHFKIRFLKQGDWSETIISKIYKKYLKEIYVMLKLSK